MRGLGDHLSIGERIAFYRKRRGQTQEVLAGLVGRSTDWLAKIETGRRKPPRIDMLAELSRILRVPLGDLLGQTVLMEDEKQQDDVPAVRDALMSPRRLSRLLFGPEAETQLPTPAPVAMRVEQAWNDYQGGRLGSVIVAAEVIPEPKPGERHQAAREHGMHALRHFYASVLLDAGENVKALSAFLGHNDPGFTLRVYTHFMPSSDARARKAVDSLYEGTVPGPDGPQTAQGQ